MGKVQKMISIDTEIADDIKNKKIQFSAWVENQYRKHELGSIAVKEKIKETTEEIENLKKLAGEIEKKEKQAQLEEQKEIQSYSLQKIEFFKTAYNRVKNGYDINANYQLFCFEFGDSIDIAKFKKLVEYYGGLNDGTSA